jgi:hypothetical protein
MKPGESEDLARAFIATSLVNQNIILQTIAKLSRLIMVIIRDDRHCLLEIDRLVALHPIKKIF